MTACITAAVAFVAFLSSALALQTHPRATTAAWVAAPPTKYAPSSPKHVLVSSAGRGKYTWVRARCARGRRNKCLMAGERGLGGGFNPLGCGWNVAEGHFMFNSVSCRSNGLQQQESSSSRRGGNSGARRGGNNGASKTKLNAIGVGVEDVGAGPRDEDAALDAGQGEQGGDLQAAVVTRKTRTGWDYWGYRVLLIGVAAIWGTNFPVVSVSIVFRLPSLYSWVYALSQRDTLLLMCNTNIGHDIRVNQRHAVQSPISVYDDIKAQPSNGRVTGDIAIISVALCFDTLIVVAPTRRLAMFPLVWYLGACYEYT